MNGYGKAQYSGETDADIRGMQMDELIRKKDAIDSVNRALDRETLLNRLVRKVAIDAIRIVPPVQPTQEIIHCKDCKHWNLQVGNVKGDGLGSCDFHNANLVTGEGFCYWADRRDEENE